MTDEEWIVLATRMRFLGFSPEALKLAKHAILRHPNVKFAYRCFVESTDHEEHHPDSAKRWAEGWNNDAQSHARATHD